LFNAFATLRGVILSNTDIAREMVTTLAEFSRLGLAQGAKETLTIEEEIEMIRHFLKIEQIRLDDYLRVSIDIDPLASQSAIPSFLLQPLVENAVKYGRMTCRKRLEISIKIKKREPGLLNIEVSNTGEWVDPGEATTDITLGVGLANIRQRLEKWSAGNFKFDKQVRHGSVIFTIIMPDSTTIETTAPVIPLSVENCSETA